MNPSPDLIAAYRAAIYRVSAPPGTSFILRVDEPNRSLDAWLGSLECEIAHVITAHNPLSKPLSSTDNQAAHARLQVQLEQMHAPYLLSEHLDPTGQWPVEHGFCIATLSRTQALGMAKAFEQNAILEHRRGHPTELVLTKP